MQNLEKVITMIIDICTDNLTTDYGLSNLSTDIGNVRNYTQH